MKRSPGIVLLVCATAWAADVSGTLTGERAGPNGNYTVTYTFRQNGARLTGWVRGPQGQPAALQDGKVEGNKIHWTVYTPSGGGIRTVTDGTIASDDEISIETKSASGAVVGGKATLRRQK